jgi:hypothetical protein
VAQIYVQLNTGRIMLEIASPIMINGRHWGAMRTCVEAKVSSSTLAAQPQASALRRNRSRPPARARRIPPEVE